MPSAGAPAPSTLDDLTNRYEALAASTDNIDAVIELDEIRRLEFKNRMKRADREKDPALKAQRQSRAYGAVREDLAYFVGRELLSGVIIPEDQKLTLLRTQGTEYLNDRYNVRGE